MLLSSNRLLLAAFAAVLSVLPRDGCADDPIAGVYDVQGTGIGGGRYEGAAKIVTNGETYEILWKIGSTGYRGLGVATRNGLAFAFSGEGFTGTNVVLYERAGPGAWCGVWTANQPGQVGKEALIRQSGDGVAPKKPDCALISASRDGVDAFDREMAWNDGDGHPQLADELRRQSGD